MKRIFKLFSIVVVALFLTGCVKYDITMEITKDGKLNFSFISAVKSDYSNYNLSSDDEEDDDEDEYDFSSEDVDDDEESDIEADTTADEEEDNDYTALKEKGFTVEDYSDDDGYEGTKVSKTYDLDKVSTSKEVTVSINDMVDADKEQPKYLMQKKVGLFKTTYVGHFTVDMSSDDGTDYSSYASNFELLYTVKLPGGVGENNATENKDNTLTWKLTYGKVNDIKFEYSKTSYLGYGVIAAVLVVVIIVVVVIIKGKKKNKTVDAASVQSVEQPTASVEAPVMEQPTAPVEVPVVEQPTAPVEAPVMEQPTAPVEAPVVEQPATTEENKTE